MIGGNKSKNKNTLYVMQITFLKAIFKRVSVQTKAGNFINLHLLG